MKKSECYKEAMKRVISSPYNENADEVIDIIQVLIHDYELALYEEREAKENV